MANTDLLFGLHKTTIFNSLKAFGIAGIFGALVWMGKKIFDLGKIMQRLETVEDDIKAVKKEVKKGNKDLVGRIDDLMITFAQLNLTESHSPRQLSNEGKRILRDSGIDTIVEDKFEYIARKVHEKKPENPYQAERTIIEVVRGLVKDPAIRDAVEEGAFISGSFPPAVLLVGATHIRDRILKKLGLNPEEIDKHRPRANK